ncbi:HAD family hydrolase [Candidatus Nitrospira bockiana]
MGAWPRAIIFDFNGVIADDETPHLLAFQQALREHGIELTQEDYYGTYLGMDERTCLTLLLRARRGRADEDLETRIHRRKAELFRAQMAAGRPPLFPGVVDFVQAAGRRARLAIASGGRREQIVLALAGTPIERAFTTIVAAEDAPVGKPDPAIYRLALARLNAPHAPAPPLRARDCLVIEDSVAGIQAARAAGMTVVAVATTYPPDRLYQADLVVPHPGALQVDRLEALRPAEAVNDPATGREMEDRRGPDGGG